jgi:hypothetical protein
MKKVSIIVTVVLALAFIAPSAQAEEKTWKIEKVGVDFHYGRDIWMPDTFRGDHSDNIVQRIAVRAESDSLMPYLINDCWNKWTIGGELHYSAHKANERPDQEQDTGFHEFGFNLVVKRNLFDRMLYLGGLAGMSYISSFPRFEDRSWNESHRNSDIGRSHYLYTVGGLLGKDWQLFHTPWSIRTEARVLHTSDPFRNDGGKNFAEGVVGVGYSF